MPGCLGRVGLIGWELFLGVDRDTWGCEQGQPGMLHDENGTSPMKGSLVTFRLDTIKKGDIPEWGSAKQKPQACPQGRVYPN